MELAHREVVEEQGVEAVLLDLGENHVELLRPLEPGHARSGKFLAKRGPGMHHVAYQVADIDATLTRCASSGLQLIDEPPRTGIRGSRVAFCTPRHRRRAHRDRRARGGTLTPWPSASASASRPAARSPCASPTSSSPGLNDALGGEGWHDLEAEDGSVRLNLAQVV